MTGRMHRRLVPASAVAVVVAAAFLPASGFGSSAAPVRGPDGIPMGLAEAIHAQLGAGAIRPSAAISMDEPYLGFGVAVSADGTTALVGARGAHHDKGAAYIFHVSDAGSWASSGTPTATLTYKDSAVGDEFGDHLALSADGTTAFIGAPYADGGSGAMYVFHVSAEDAWASSSTPTATLSSSHDDGLGFTLAVSSDGTTLVAGVPFYHNNAGGALVFHVSSEGSWVSSSLPTAALTYAGEPHDDYWVGGHLDVSADGTTALLSDQENPNGGGADVFHVSAEDAWTSSSTPTAVLTDPSNDPYNAPGNSVALSADGTVALVGSPYVNAETGAVDVFHASGEAAWASTSTPTATLTDAGGSAGATFGETVAVSADGTTALLTAPGLHRGRGAAYIFRVADEGSWASSSAPTATLTDSDGVRWDSLGLGGLALSADGATALAGVPGARFGTGAADIFHAADASSWATTSAPTATLTDSRLDRCVVPRLKGLTVTAAKAALRARSCRLGRVRRVQAHARTGHVVSQSFEAGSRLPVGTRIAIKVAR